MNNKYLENISNSPYVSAGAFNKAILRDANGLKHIFEVAIQPVNTTPKNRNVVATDLMDIVAKVIELIVYRVKRDPDTAPYFSHKQSDGTYQLPKSWDEPAVTSPEWLHIAGSNLNDKQPRYEPSEPIFDPQGNKIKDPLSYTHIPKNPMPKTGIDEESNTTDKNKKFRNTADLTHDVKDSKDFVYQLASLYNKFPGKYTIEVTEGGGTNLLLSGSNKKVLMRVLWKWNKHENIIYALVKNADKNLKDNEWKSGDILKFYDDQVNPRSPSYTGMNIGLFMKQSNRKLESFYFKYEKVDQNLNELAPSLYACIRRKGVMEFKAKDKVGLGLEVINGTFDKNSTDYGKLRVGRGEFMNSHIDQDGLYNIFIKSNKSQQESLVSELSDIKYFEHFPELKIKLDSFGKINVNSQSAILQVQKMLGINFTQAKELVNSKVKEMGESDSTSDYVSKVVFGSTNPAIMDTIMALLNMKTYTIEQATSELKNAIKILGTEDTTENYITAILKKKPAPKSKRNPPKKGPENHTNELINPFQKENFI